MVKKKPRMDTYRERHHAVVLYLRKEQGSAVRELAAKTRIPQAVLLREAVDDLLQKHADLE